MRFVSFRLAIFALFLFASSIASADASTADAEPAHATFALIIGVNQSVDVGVATLRYADDDAARYLDLFRSLGARTYVLTRPDDNTKRVHPQVVAEALSPTQVELRRALASLAADVA